MALTFFWRCEGTTLDGTDDFTAGDSTASANNSPEVSATAARVGSNGLLFDGSLERYDFDPTGLISPSEGCIGFWVQAVTSIPAGAGARPFFCRGTGSFNDHISITLVSVAGNGRIRLTIRSDAGGAIDLTTATANLSAATWYFVVVRWRSASSLRRIEVYDTTLALLDSLEDSSTDFSANVPVDLNDSLRLGETLGLTDTYYMDNVFIATNYDEPVESNATITSFTNYSSGDTATVTPAQAVLTIEGLQVTTSAFQHVRIREVLVNASGQAVGNASDISLLVWYGGRPVGAPDLSYAGLTTDTNGTTSWSLATGGLSFNQPIFYVAAGSDASLSAWTCARMIPSYE